MKATWAVTGASGGIGQAFVQMALGQKATAVYAVGRNTERMRNSIQSPAVQLVPLDYSNESEVRNFIEQMPADSPLRIVHAAGTIVHEVWGQLESNSVARQIEANLTSTIWLLDAILRRSFVDCSVLVIGSTLAERPLATSGVYSATKAAVEALTKSSALAGAEKGIRVNCLQLGVVETPMTAQPRGPMSASEVIASLASLIPLKRVGTPDEVAVFCRHLMESMWLTGSVVRFDGGLCLSNPV
jgi:3-oxoacyl-[acyl-carrier protein] reductase